MIHQNLDISICIPTFQRSDLLREAVQSCVQQNYKPREILIGIDADRGEPEERVLGDLDMREIDVVLERSSIRLGQANNVNRLFDRAAYPWLVLLHDDDRLLPDALGNLVCAAECYDTADVIYGRQQIIDAAGGVMETSTKRWNEKYLRHADHVGYQPSSISAALCQQIPNDGYLVRTLLARRVRYRHESEVGHGVDAEFGVRLAAMAGRRKFVFIDENISQYRMNPVSISHSKEINRREDLLFEAISRFAVKPHDMAAKDLLLTRIALSAMLDAARAGRRLFALRVMFSRYYKKGFWTRWTLYRLMSILSPGLARKLRSLVVALSDTAL